MILGEESELTHRGVSRRFDGNDTLENVLDWIGGVRRPGDSG